MAMIPSVVMNPLVAMLPLVAMNGYDAAMNKAMNGYETLDGCY